MISRGETVSNFDAIRSAFKRASHFRNVDFDGPFTAISGNPIGRNYAMFLDADTDPEGDLTVMHLWAKAINRQVDARLVGDDIEFREVMSSFLSRFWFDPSKLG